MSARAPWLLAVLLLGGCVSYAELADAQRRNIDLLWDLELSLSLRPEQQKAFRLDLGRQQNPTLRANDSMQSVLATRRKEWLDELYTTMVKLEFNAAFMRASAAETELAVASSQVPEEHRAVFERAERVRIQERLFGELDVSIARIRNLMALYEATFVALKTLRDSGEQALEYFELDDLERITTDVEGFDKEQLKAIGDQLETLWENLEPYRDQLLEGTGL